MKMRFMLILYMTDILSENNVIVANFLHKKSRN